MQVKKYETRLTPGGVAYIAETGAYRADGRRQYQSPEMLVSFFEGIGIREMAEEYVYCACIDNRLHLIGCFEASHGSAAIAHFPIREILQKALLIGASAIAICHNHPSGDPTPSGLDLEGTKKLEDACGVIGISLIDHIIMPANSAWYFSFANEGLIGLSEKKEEIHDG